MIERIEEVGPASGSSQLHQVIVTAHFGGNKGHDGSNTSRINLIERASNVERLVVTAFVNERIKSIDELLLLLTVAGHAVDQQTAFTGGGKFFLTSRVELVLYDGCMLRLAQCALEFVGQLSTHIWRKFRGTLNVVERELEILYSRLGIVAHAFAGIDHSIFNFATQHLAEHAALLLDFIHQCAGRGELIGKRARYRRSCSRRRKIARALTRLRRHGLTNEIQIVVVGWGHGRNSGGGWSWSTCLRRKWGLASRRRNYRLGHGFCFRPFFLDDALDGFGFHIAWIACQNSVCCDLGALNVASGDSPLGEIGHSVDTCFGQPTSFSESGGADARQRDAVIRFGRTHDLREIRVGIAAVFGCSSPVQLDWLTIGNKLGRKLDGIG